jgi:hypothetical protein
MNLAEEIGRYLPQGAATGSTLGNVAGVAAVGGILGELFGGGSNSGS